MSKIAILLLFMPSFLFAADIGIIGVYGGKIGDDFVYKAKGTSLEDSGGFYGLYAQYVKSEKYQGNIFIYKAGDINYGKLSGWHFNFDGYFSAGEKTKYSAGLAAEDINVKINAVNKISGLALFKADKTVNIYLFRGGVNYKSEWKKIDFSIMPYAGIAVSDLDGYVATDPLGPAPYVKTDISQKSGYCAAGANITLKPYRFAEFQFKYAEYFRHENKIRNANLSFNFFLSRNFGLSYRYKKINLDLEKVKNDISYHMMGLVFAFGI